jgi:hypothetical protein
LADEETSILPAHKSPRQVRRVDAGKHGKHDRDLLWKAAADLRRRH